MTNHYEEIDLILTKQNDEVVQAHKEIVALQKGEGHVIKTGQEDLDYFLVGGLNNKMVFIGSRPSMGKTYHCETTIDNLLNREINPYPYISILRMNLEMQTKSLLLRDLKKSLGKKMIDIISTPYTLQEQEIVKKVVSKHRDKRIINFSKSVEGEELRYLITAYRRNIDIADELRKAQEMTEYLEKHGTLEGYVFHPTQKIILIDHLHIYQTKAQIDAVLSICNEMKMQDSNLSFIIYFQFNRTLEDVWRDTKEKKANPKNFLPHSGHIYNTDSLMQFADVVMGMVIPQVVDLEEFVSVYKERNLHLKDHFAEDVLDNTTARLKGRNRIYYNYIKIRLVDDFEDPRLYCKVLSPEYEETANKISEENKATTTKYSKDPVFSTPELVVEPPIKPNFDMGAAFGEPDEINDDNPFA